MAKKASQKAVTKQTRKQKAEPVYVEMSDTSLTSNPAVETRPNSTSKISSRTLTFALVVLGIALLTYKVGPYFVPAMIGYSPVTRFEVWQRLEKSYGTQALDDLVNEKILDSAIAKSGVKVEQSRIDDQLKNLETQFETLGGLDAALEQRGMTKDELIKQIKTQLSVEEILKDKVTPTDDEIKKAFDEGAKTTYKDKKFEEVSSQIKDELTQTKLVEAFRDWFEMIKAEAKIKNFGL